MESTARAFNANVDHALADPNLQDSLAKLKVGFSERRRQAAQLKREFEEVLGGRPASEVVNYCGSGVAACHNVLAMEIAGLAPFARQLELARATVYFVGQNAMLLGEIKPLAFNALSWYERLDPGARKRIDRLRVYYKQLEAAEITLKGLAEETGGAIWIPGTREEFGKLSPQISTEIGAEYLFAYSTERQPGDTRFHAINVYATIPGLQVRSRRGIYASVIAKREAGRGESVEGEVAERAARKALVRKTQPVISGLHHGLLVDNLQFVAIGPDATTN
jgi:hypothetical protein